MTILERTKKDLVIANRILAAETVMDAYGHVSIRHPVRDDRFFLSRSLSPAMVTVDDLMEFDLEGTPVGGDERHPYVERFIHGAIYAHRDDVHVVAHSHATEVLPYTITAEPLRPAIHSAGVIGRTVPRWDIRERFDDTNMLVTNLQQGADLAERLGVNKVVLMRGHGFSAAAGSLAELVRICVYIRINAHVLSQALPLGDVTYLTDGEIENICATGPDSPEVQRAWRYWAGRAGCGDMLAG